MKRPHTTEVIMLMVGAELQNLLKLFEAIVDGSLPDVADIPPASKSKQLIIY